MAKTTEVIIHLRPQDLARRIGKCPMPHCEKPWWMPNVEESAVRSSIEAAVSDHFLTTHPQVAPPVVIYK